MERVSVGVHRLMRPVNIYQSFLGKEDCEKIVSAYPKISKMENAGLTKDNLYNTQRTDWWAHKESPIVLEVWHNIAKCFCRIFTQDRTIALENIEVSLFESWIAVSDSKAMVEPHIHGYSTTWSFVFYALVPSGQTSLTFSTWEGDNLTVPAREGDFIIFPADTGHYSTDTEPGRTIFSGNFTANFLPRDNSDLGGLI